MLFTKKTLLLASALTATVSAATFPSGPNGDDPMAGYTIIDLEWTVKPFPDRDETVNVTGPIEKVISEMSKINPNFESQVLATASSNIAALEAAAAANTTVTKRVSYQSHFCFGRWPTCSAQAIYTGVMYLNGVPGQPSMGPGPGVCGRVSCSHDSGIYWCNDHTTSYTLPSFVPIGEGAYAIMSWCDYKGWTSGQFFTQQNWNVVVRGDNWGGC
ncbi:hypothetical protein QBC34DRAFT_461269 [Podospora aff. communis PSN243]|uniref:Secreted protein n=1 Tax=Podospora aff. communis PSN243 TaxID=3040156 RepID=A0AAV9GS64_9PEZI|nr:hypothetical protein QBC34DRAFT_461269 [Podospora aff. communis PSN243]